MGVTEDVSQFIVGWPGERIPREILHDGARCLVNYVSVALLGSRDPSLDLLLAHFAEEGANPRATIIGRGGMTSLANAALANGYLGHVDDYDDTHIPIDYRDNIHPSSPIFPAALAAGEHVGAPGAAVLDAGVIGIEVALRVGMVISGAFRPGASNWHITATCGILGAASAAGRILGLTPEQMTYALGLAATQASGLTDVFGSMTKPFHTGRAAQGGLTAALLAQKGFTSSRRILEAPHGFINAMSEGYDLEILTGRLGAQWELPRVGLKPYPCGAGNHALIDAMLALRQREGASVDNVESVSAQVRSAADQLIRQRHPTTGLETKFSYFHAMAAAFVDGAAFPTQFTLEKATDPTIAALRDRISVSSDPSLFGRSAVVTMVLKDGRSYTERIPHPTGTPEKPMSDDEVSAKFCALADGVIEQEQAEALLAALWNLGQIPDFRAVMRLAAGADVTSIVGGR